MPRSRHALATSSESVATTTGSISLLAVAARQTHSTIGRPAMVRNTLRLSRVELSRAGMTPAMRNVFIQASLQERKGTESRSSSPAQARQYYEQFDFVSSPADPLHLMVLLKDIRKHAGV
jgi:hypothetical protein